MFFNLKFEIYNLILTRFPVGRQMADADFCPFLKDKSASFFAIFNPACKCGIYLFRHINTNLFIINQPFKITIYFL